MLSEAFKYLTTPCAPHLKSMGYLTELIALDARFKRCQAAWQPHLDKTISVISDAVDGTQQRKKVIVLGAGILSDIPIKALSESFEAVVLVDICFLNQTRRMLRHFRNVEFIRGDITGIAAPVFSWTRSGTDLPEFPKPALPEVCTLVDADLVISANVLSQLPLTPVSILQKSKLPPDENSISSFAKTIIDSHLAFLNTCPGRICLITEIERQFIDGDHLLETEDPLYGYDFQIDGDEWFWDLAPKGEVSPDYGIRNHVIGWHWQPRM